MQANSYVQSNLPTKSLESTSSSIVMPKEARQLLSTMSGIFTWDEETSTFFSRVL